MAKKINENDENDILFEIIDENGNVIVSNDTTNNLDYDQAICKPLKYNNWTLRVVAPNAMIKNMSGGMRGIGIAFSLIYHIILELL